MSVIGEIDGRRSVAQIGRRLGIAEQALTEAIASLVIDGFIADMPGQY
jgi:predicted transcriptional regulator